jgi:hypothetical protein
MYEILRYYQDEAGEVVADRFYQTFLQVADRALGNPEYFHPVSEKKLSSKSGPAREELPAQRPLE